jgi:hypothetical protein
MPIAFSISDAASRQSLVARSRSLIACAISQRIDLNRAQEAVSVRPAGEGAMFQDRKFGTGPFITLVEKTVVVSERYLNEHLHGPNLISERRQSMSQI